MMNLEDRVRFGLHATAELIPETENGPSEGRAKTARFGVWIGVAAVLAVFAFFSPLFLFFGSEPDGAQREPSGQVPSSEEDITPAEVGFEFTNPEHVRLRFTQDLTLVCEGMDTVDNGGFDSFDMDIWIDHSSGFTRLGIEYPDASSYELILEGKPDEWERAWGSGTDLGRSAGCREPVEDGGYSQSIAGWAFQDASPLWFEAYLKPVTSEDAVVVINHEGSATRATSIGPRTYLVESNAPDGSRVSFEYMLDGGGLRVVGDNRLVQVPSQYEANATIEVLDSGPTTLPAGIFDTSTFTPLWGGNPPPTTEATTP